MRSSMLLGLVGMGFVVTLLHCAQSDASAPSPDVAEAGGTAPSPDGGATPRPDADEPVVDDAGDGGDDSHCSVDHWCRVPLPSRDIGPTGVWTFAPDNALAVGSGGMIHWDGKAWSVVTNHDDQDAGLAGLTDLWASGPNDVWVLAQSDNRIIHGTGSEDGGLAWSSSQTSSLAFIQSIAGRAGELWLAGTSNAGTAMLERAAITDSGPPSFSQVPVPITRFQSRALWVSSNGDVWLLGRKDELSIVTYAQRTGDGLVWQTSLELESAADLHAIGGIANATTLADQNDIWLLAGDHVNGHHTLEADGGSLWTPVPSATEVALGKVWMSAKDDAWAVGTAGFVRHWDGTSWKVSQLSVHGRPLFEFLSSIHGSSVNDIWAVGPNVLVHHTGGAP